METDHFIHLGDVMKKRVFVVGEERVWNPYFFGEVPGQSHVVLGIRREGQPIVLPVLVEVDSDGVVLTSQYSRHFYRLTD